MLFNAGDCSRPLQPDWTRAPEPDCLDQDFGATVDRVSFETQMFNLTAIAMLDWAASGPTSDRLAAGLTQFGGEPFDVTNNADVDQYGIIVGRIDAPEQWKEKVDRGGTVWNLAVYLTHRNQDLDQDVRQSLPLGDPKTDEKKAGQQLVRRDFSTNVADF